MDVSPLFAGMRALRPGYSGQVSDGFHTIVVSRREEALSMAGRCCEDGERVTCLIRVIPKAPRDAADGS